MHGLLHVIAKDWYPNGMHGEKSQSKSYCYIMYIHASEVILLYHVYTCIRKKLVVSISPEKGNQKGPIKVHVTKVKFLYTSLACLTDFSSEKICSYG